MATPATQVTQADVLAELSTSGTAYPERQGNLDELSQEQIAFPTPQEAIASFRVSISIPARHMLEPAGARPTSIMFGVLNDPEYRLRIPIPLEVETEQEHVIVNWAETEEFGVGENLSDAISDFARSLRSLHRSLAQAKCLGPDLLRVRNKLNEYLEVRPR